MVNIPLNTDFRQISFLAETSWEACNKVGGIHTVLSTKARELKAELGDKVVFIGPDMGQDNNSGFKHYPSLLKKAETKLNLPMGIKIRTGRWNVPGLPLTILVEFNGVEPSLNSFYKEMWDDFGVDSLHAYGDYNNSCAFAIASAIVIEELLKHLKINEGCIAHFDEWTTGMGLLYLKKNVPSVATIFTTHATCIGRSICGNGKNLYQYFEGYYGDQMASELNMQSKHSLEKAAAHAADCFTTVSEVTARECAQLLEIRPQVVTPNGFEPAFVPEKATALKQRIAGREKLSDIASCMLNRAVDKDTLFIATAGRNEYRNKGLDAFIDALCLVRQLESKPVIGFVMVPAWVKEPDSRLKSLLENGETLRSPREFIVSTHRLNNEAEDHVLNHIITKGADDSKVALIYIPCYLDGNDGIVDISYYSLLPAFDMTVFPSYYEPWGYTPLESIAFGVPTITSDKSGFGQWIEHHFGNELTDSGVKVTPRSDTDYHGFIQTIASTIADFSNLPEEKREELSEKAQSTANTVDWKTFISYYHKAFAIALKNAGRRLGSRAASN